MRSGFEPLGLDEAVPHAVYFELLDTDPGRDVVGVLVEFNCRSRRLRYRKYHEVSSSPPAKCSVRLTTRQLVELLEGDERERLAAGTDDNFQASGLLHDLIMFHALMQGGLRSPTTEPRVVAMDDDSIRRQVGGGELGSRAMTRTSSVVEEQLGRSCAGAQVCVSVRGVAKYRAARGFANADTVMSPDTKVPWFCASKPIVAVGLARLWEQGLLDLWDPVAKYVRYFRGGPKDAVKIVHLLTHTGPLALQADPLAPISFGAPEDRRRALADFTIPEGAVPGEVHNYGYWWAWFLLSEIIETVTGVAANAYLTKEVLCRSGMSNTTLRMTTCEYKAVSPKLGRMFYVDGDTASELSMLTSEKECTSFVPGMGAWGPVSDLARLYESVLASLWEPSGQLLTQPVARVLVSRATGVLPVGAIRGEWGLGFRLEAGYLSSRSVYNGNYVSRHAFGFEGLSSTKAFADPETGIVVAFLMNGVQTRTQHRQRVVRLVDAIYEDLHELGYIDARRSRPTA